MNLLADESVEREVVEYLRTDGHAIVYVAELSPSITDDRVLDEANARSDPLVTARLHGQAVCHARPDGRSHVLSIWGSSPRPCSCLPCCLSQLNGVRK